MAEDPPRQPVVLRIKVRYATADAFVERFAPYVARAGLFLRSKQPKPVGTEVRFELRLSDDAPVLVGMGIVRWAREPDPDKPYTPPGMAIEFTRVTKESRGVILKMLELRRALGLADGPRGLPAPPDDDVAVIAATTAAATAAAVASETSAPPESAPVMMTGPVQAVIAVETAPVTAPPAWSGPAAPAQLEPLAARPRRPAAAELVASVSASTLTGLDNAFGDLDAEQADVPGILARARAMVGHDLDGELANLLDQDAAPVAITIEEASAGLASLFGTAPVSKRNRRAADDSVPVPSRPAFSAPPPVTATAAVVTAAAEISADLFAPVAPEPADTQVEPAQDDPPMRTVEAPTDVDAEARAAEAEAEAAAAVAGLVEVPAQDPDPDRTRVVKLDGLAELTAAPPEGATRVVSLDALAAASAVRDSDERTAIAQRPERPAPSPGPDEERTRVVPIRARSVDEDARTRIVHARELDRAADELDETLDFDRPARAKVPRDFADEPEVETSVRMRPLPPSGSGPRPAPERPARRTSPPPPPGRRLPPDAGSARRAQSPVQAPLADDSHDEDLTPPPVDPGDAPTHSIDLRAPREPTPVPARLPRAESSGSFELDDLVAELSAEAATPVPVRPERSAGLDGLGRSLAGDALDADGIMADLDDIGRRRAPEGPFPDLASFADPPSAIPRRGGTDRADSLDAALAALDGADDDADAEAGEERTHLARPTSQPASRPEASADDDDIEIEIELDE